MLQFPYADKLSVAKKRTLMEIKKGLQQIKTKKYFILKICETAN